MADPAHVAEDLLSSNDLSFAKAFNCQIMKNYEN